MISRDELRKLWQEAHSYGERGMSKITMPSHIAIGAVLLSFLVGLSAGSNLPRPTVHVTPPKLTDKAPTPKVTPTLIEVPPVLPPPVGTPSMPTIIAPVPIAPVVPVKPRAARKDRAERMIACLKPEARALLDRIEAQFGEIEVISTCRPGATVAGTDHPSRHRYGLAIDFNAPSGKKEAIVKWLLANHKSGGTMTYCCMSHIHVDIGPRFVSIAGNRKVAHSGKRRRVHDDDWW